MSSFRCNMSISLLIGFPLLCSFTLQRIKDYSIYTWDEQSATPPLEEKQIDKAILVDHQYVDEETETSVDLEDRQTYNEKRQAVMNKYIKGATTFHFTLAFSKVVIHCQLPVGLLTFCFFFFFFNGCLIDTNRCSTGDRLLCQYWRHVYSRRYLFPFFPLLPSCSLTLFNTILC